MFLSVQKILMQLLCALRTDTSGLEKLGFFTQFHCITCNSSPANVSIFPSYYHYLSGLLFSGLLNVIPPSWQSTVWGAAQRLDSECTWHVRVFKSDKIVKYSSVLSQSILFPTRKNQDFPRPALKMTNSSHPALKFSLIPHPTSEKMLMPLPPNLC